MFPAPELAVRPHVMTCPCGGLTRPLGKPAPVCCVECGDDVPWDAARFVGIGWTCLGCLAREGIAT